METPEDTTTSTMTETTDTVETPAVVDAAVETTGDDEGTVLGGKEGDPPVAADPAPEVPVIPDAYELAAPEGMDLDPELLAEATPIFKELGLTNEAAQQLMPVAGKLAAKIADSTIERLVDAGNQQRKAWLDAAKADAEIGGPKWDATLHASARGLDALGFNVGSDFRKALTETGFGNHPDMIRAFAKIGQMVGEDGDFVRPDAGVRVEVPIEKRLYPND